MQAGVEINCLAAVQFLQEGSFGPAYAFVVGKPLALNPCFYTLEVRLEVLYRCCLYVHALTPLCPKNVPLW